MGNFYYKEAKRSRETQQAPRNPRIWVITLHVHSDGVLNAFDGEEFHSLEFISDISLVLNPYQPQLPLAYKVSLVGSVWMSDVSFLRYATIVLAVALSYLHVGGRFPTLL